MGPSRSCWNGTTSILQPVEVSLKVKLIARQEFKIFYNDVVSHCATKFYSTSDFVIYHDSLVGPKTTTVHIYTQHRLTTGCGGSPRDPI